MKILSQYLNPLNYLVMKNEEMNVNKSSLEKKSCEVEFEW